MGIIVGAYAAAPSLTGWDPQAEAEYFDRLFALQNVRGLELPWPGRLHAHDEQWLLAHLPSRADVVVSDIGNVVGSLATDASYGLASQDSAGRARAIADAARLRDDVARLDEASGRRQVIAVELHSAPLATAGSTAALRASLEEIAGWDWNGAAVLIEHCDTLIADQRPEKGYLTLDDEIAALSGLGESVGLSLNWGRSAIELRAIELRAIELRTTEMRSADAVAAQVAHAAASGLLRGLVFSGAADVDNAYGPAWEDNHPPFAPDAKGGDGEPSSLLTAERAAAARAAAGDLDWVAVKMGYRPLGAPINEKLAMIERAVRIATPSTPGNAALGETTPAHGPSGKRWRTS